MYCRELCAITKVVLFFVRFKIAFCTISSESASNEEVASSNKIIGTPLVLLLLLIFFVFDHRTTLFRFHQLKYQISMVIFQ